MQSCGMGTRLSFNALFYMCTSLQFLKARYKMQVLDSITSPIILNCFLSHCKVTDNDFLLCFCCVVKWKIASADCTE